MLHVGLKLLSVVVLALAQSGNSGLPAGATSRELDPKTRPFLAIAEFKNVQNVTVSQYTSPDDKGRMQTVRVYRFTYRARFSDEKARWKKVFLRHRWRTDKDEQNQLIISRDVKHPKIKWQALILSAGKWIFDASVRSRTRREPLPDWVTVSFNENLKP